MNRGGGSKVFKEKFCDDNSNDNFSMLESIPTIIALEENKQMIKLPNQEEVNKAIFQLNSISATSPDGFSSLFFQTYWEIVSKDANNIIRVFFCGQTLL